MRRRKCSGALFWNIVDPFLAESYHQGSREAALFSEPEGLLEELTMNTTESTPNVISPYLTAKEAALYLRTTIQGIYSLVKRERIRPMPGSGKLLFTRDALDRYLTTRRRP